MIMIHVKKWEMIVNFLHNITSLVKRCITHTNGLGFISHVTSVITNNEINIVWIIEQGGQYFETLYQTSTKATN